MNEQLDRAEWQRGEGMVMFRQMSDGLFDDVDKTISDHALAEALINAERIGGEHLEYNKAYEVGSALVSASRLKYDSNRLIRDIAVNPAAAGRLDKMTFADSTMQLYDEVVSSVFNLPLNIMELAQRKSRVLHPDKSVYQNLGNIAGIMTSKWFGSVMYQAAFTKNAYWTSLSSLPVDSVSLNGADKVRSVSFDYDESGENLTFDFDASTKEDLLNNLRSTNQNYRSPNPAVTAGEVYGTTSGCPARNHHAVVDPEVGADLAKRYGKTVEELAGPRDTNGIQDSLACLGRLLTRAAAIESDLK